MTEKLLASIAETQEMTDHSRSYVYELIAAGKLEAVKSGRRRLVLIKSIREYVESLRAAA
jgi:excisionase family DNA binding protein